MSFLAIYVLNVMFWVIASHSAGKNEMRGVRCGADESIQKDGRQ